MEIEKRHILFFGILGLLGILWLLSPLLDAIAYGVLLAYLSRPMAYYIRKVVGPGIASGLTLLALILGITALLIFSATQIISEVSGISPDQFISSFVSASQTLNRFLQSHPQFNPLVNAIASQLDNYLNWLSSRIFDFIFGMVNFIITLVMGFVIAFFLLYDGPKLRKFLEKALPEPLANQIDRVDKNLEGIYVGSLLSAFIVGLITSLTFLLTGVPYPFISGFFAALLQFIPMVGPQLFLIPGAFVAVVYRDYFHALVLLALAVFLFFVPDNVIKPLILKRTTGIHPLLVLLSFIGGVLIFGPAGFIIGPLILAIGDGLIHAWLG